MRAGAAGAQQPDSWALSRTVSRLLAYNDSAAAASLLWRAPILVVWASARRAYGARRRGLSGLDPPMVLCYAPQPLSGLRRGADSGCVVCGPVVRGGGVRPTHMSTIYLILITRGGKSPAERAQMDFASRGRRAGTPAQWSPRQAVASAQERRAKAHQPRKPRPRPPKHSTSCLLAAYCWLRSALAAAWARCAGAVHRIAHCMAHRTHKVPACRYVLL